MSTRYSVEEARQLPFFGERFVFPKNVGMGIVSPGEKGAIIEIDKTTSIHVYSDVIDGKETAFAFSTQGLIAKTSVGVSTEFVRNNRKRRLCLRIC